MLIMDGFLNYQTLIISYVITLPLWAFAVWKTKKTLKSKYIPTLAIGSAFCLIIMMFDIPVFGRLTGHAIGATLLSLIFGPWASSIIISITLAIQALFFENGGILSLAANSLIIGFLASFTGYYSYKFLISLFPNEIRAKMLASGISGYISLVIASIFIGIILGIQPLLNYTANSTSLYFPNSFKISIPLMLIGHILIFGWVEFIITALSLGFLLKEKSPVLNFSKEDLSLIIN